MNILNPIWQLQIMRNIQRLVLRAITCLMIVITANAWAFDADRVTELLNNPNRDLSDHLKDTLNKPLEMMKFLGFDEGMTVLDVYAADGYFTVILSAVVGKKGKVIAQNSIRALSYQVDRTDVTAGNVLQKKLDTLALTNVIRLDKSMARLELEPESLDGVLLSKIFHDYYNRNPERAQELLATLKSALKPGGVIGLIDHDGNPQNDNLRFHRIPKQKVIDAVKKAGLIIDGESTLLSNPKDDHRRSIFEPALNGNTDRFVLRIIKQ